MKRAGNPIAKYMNMVNKPSSVKVKTWYNRKNKNWQKDQ